MKTGLFLGLTAVLLVTGCCSSRTRPRTAGLEQSMERLQSSVTLHPKFGPDGHQYTTFLVSSFAGRSRAESLALTYYSQYPDEDGRYRSVDVSLWTLFVPWKWCWRTDINKQLHSLHGGANDAVQARRAALAGTIAAKLREPGVNRLWQAGLMIHAFGDAYSHTKGEFGISEQAYGPLYGHALAGKFPDEIAHPAVFPRYCAYVRNLFNALSASGKVDGAKKVEDYLAALRAKVCEPGAPCGADQINRMRDAIIDQCKQQGGFSPTEYAEYSKNAPSLGEGDVQQVMDEIKGRPTRH